MNSPTSLSMTLPQLLKATALALALAATLLVTAILPAEYGIDPTGAGRVLGLTTLAGADPDAEVSIPVAEDNAGATVVQYDVSFHSEELSMTLQPGEGGEIKALMRTGESIVFSWAADGGTLSFDMHGEKLNAGDEFSSYWKDRDYARANGRFVAPFDGTHGWYWKNRGTEPVTVNVKVSGFFEKLYRPG
ncbi:MAG: hypothetical protein M3O62_02065 [Pseudomonadota bacterium]|nr:hypothetical protein [Pseudomonadota bacterium]